MNGTTPRRDDLLRIISTLWTKTVGGYLGGASKFLTVVVLLVIIAFASVAIAFPLWFLSTTSPQVYTVVALVFGTVAILFFTGKKIANGKTLLALANFSGLLIEFCLIMFFFIRRHAFIVPAVVLSIEFIVFLVMIASRARELLSPWMHVTLSLLAFFGFMYFSAVLAREGNFAVAIPLSIVYLLAFGYMIHDRRKPLIDARTDIRQKK